MQYSVMEFDQKKLIELGMDSIDVFILKFIFHLPSWATLHIAPDGDRYFWCNYKELLLDYPVLNIKKDTVKSRIKKYCKCGLIKLYIWKSKDGTKSMTAITDLFLSLKYENKKKDPSVARS
jgi:hypothetical protein